MPSRVARIFISSTFRDFVAERDLLARVVLPELQRRARDRFVEVIGIDLRWGITEAESQSGAAIPICLREIDRARPFFVCLLGERHGWTPSAAEYPADVLASSPWLAEHAGRASVTEIEVLHGVLNDRSRAGRALFFLRDSHWGEGRGADFAGEGSRERERLAGLKDRIRASGLHVSDYDSPESLPHLVTEQLWGLIDAEYPAGEVPDACARDALAHEAFGSGRREVAARDTRLLADIRRLGGAIDGGSATNAGRLVLVRAREGAGKTTLLACAADQWREHRPGDAVFVHHVGATRESSGAVHLLRRLARFCSEGDPAEAGLKELAREMPHWLAGLSDRLEREDGRALIILDSLDRIDGPAHVPWLPAFIPARITIVAASDAGHTTDVLAARADIVLTIPERDPAERSAMLRALLARQGKSLDEMQIGRITAHPLAGTPGFLAAVIHDLCVSATHETLSARIDEVLLCAGIDDVLEHAVAVAELTAGREAVRRACVALVTSRDGLTVDELYERCDLPPLSWARVEAALGPILAPAGDLTIVAGGYARRAIQDRYALRGDALRDAHSAAADWWLHRGPSPRAAYELPLQLASAGRLEDLRSLLVDRCWIGCLLLHLSEDEILASWRKAGGDDLDVAREYDAALGKWEGQARLPPDGEFFMRLGGFVNYAAGPGDVTLELLERAVALARVSQRPESELALRLNNLGHEQLMLDRVEEATRSFAEALEIRGRCLPEGHPHTLGTIDNLGQAHHAAGRRDDAVRHLRAALKLRLRHLGDHDAETSTSRNNLAMLLLDGAGDAADLPEAGCLLEEAYASSTHALGARHPDTAISAGNLGLFHASHGDEARARELMETALAIHLERFGADHEYVAVGRARLDDLELRRGVRARNEGRLADARAILTAEVARRAGKHGRASLQWAAAASALAETVGREGEVAAARELLSRVLEVREQELGAEHQLTRLAAERLRGLANKA